MEFCSDREKTHILDHLIAFLRIRPRGVTEYDFLRELRADGVPFFPNGDVHDRLHLFRSHFVLFHLLYLLRDELRRKTGEDIFIHCLDIRIVPMSVSDFTTLPDAPDPLRAYYLDLENVVHVEREHVDKMLTDFWKNFGAQGDREEHLRALGLTGHPDPREIRTRYRALARIHHPDRGGNATRFRAITEAASQLLYHP